MRLQAPAAGDADKVLDALDHADYPWADVNAQDVKGRTAVMHAVRGDERFMLKSLLHHQPDLEIQDSYGKRAINYAHETDNLELGTVLLEHRAQPIYPYLADVIEEAVGEMLTDHPQQDPASAQSVPDNKEVLWRKNFAALRNIQDEITRELGEQCAKKKLNEFTDRFVATHRLQNVSFVVKSVVSAQAWDMRYTPEVK